MPFYPSVCLVILLQNQESSFLLFFILEISVQIHHLLPCFQDNISHFSIPEIWNPGKFLAEGSRSSYWCYLWILCLIQALQAKKWRNTGPPCGGSGVGRIFIFKSKTTELPVSTCENNNHWHWYHFRHYKNIFLSWIKYGCGTLVNCMNFLKNHLVVLHSLKSQLPLPSILGLFLRAERILEFCW